MLSFPSQHIQLCARTSKAVLAPVFLFRPFRCAACCFSHPKEGIWGARYLGGGCYRGMCPCLVARPPSEFKLTPGHVWSFAVCLSNLFMGHLCKIHTHLLLLLSPPSSNSRAPWVLTCAHFQLSSRGSIPSSTVPALRGARRRQLRKC